MLEGEALIPNKFSSELCVDEKMANNGGEGFILVTKFYKSPKYASLLAVKK